MADATPQVNAMQSQRHGFARLRGFGKLGPDAEGIVGKLKVRGAAWLVFQNDGLEKV